MVIEVQLFGTLRQICSFGSTGVVSVDIPDGYTLLELIRELEIQSESLSQIKLNGTDASRIKKLQDGDTVVLYPK